MSSKKIIAAVVIAILVVMVIGAGVTMGGDTPEKEEPAMETFVKIGFKDGFTDGDQHSFRTTVSEENIFVIEAVSNTVPKLFRTIDMDGEKADITYENLRDCVDAVVLGLTLSFEESKDKGTFNDYSIRLYGSMTENGSLKPSDKITAGDRVSVEATLYSTFEVEKAGDGSYLVSGKECEDAKAVIDAVNPDSDPSKYQRMGYADITTNGERHIARSSSRTDRTCSHQTASS